MMAAASSSEREERKEGTEARVWAALAAVVDPEIDVSLVDLGVIRSVEIEDGAVLVVMTPTRTACPGVHEMRRRVTEAVQCTLPGAKTKIDWKIGIWNPSYVSSRGRDSLRESGYVVAEEGISQLVSCPYCRSTDVRREGSFGGSVCKTPYSCRSCGSTFDQLGVAQCLSCKGT